MSGAIDAQEQVKSFQFDGEPIEQVLKAVVEAYGCYLSYKPGIFEQIKPVSQTLSKVTLQGGLNQLLGEDFQYKIIGKYVVITKRVPKVVESVKKPGSPVVYDTIPIPKVVVVYDTQTVVKKQIQYDTITIEKLMVTYDTVQVGLSTYSSTDDRWSFGGFVGALQRNRSGGFAEASYSGVEIGGSVQHRRGNYTFQLDLSYQYLIDQVTNSTIEEITETRIDTISTFFIIRDGIREPVYITETTEVTSELRTEIDRTNTLQFLGLSLTGGYQYPMGNVSVGLRVGIRADWLVSGDEWLFSNNQRVDDQRIQYAAPSTSVVAHFPITLQKQGLIGTFSLTPFFQYGLNRDIATPNLGGDRRVFGVRIGVLF